MDRHSHNVFVVFRGGRTDRRGEKRKEEGEEERKTSEVKRFAKMFDQKFKHPQLEEENRRRRGEKNISELCFHLKSQRGLRNDHFHLKAKLPMIGNKVWLTSKHGFPIRCCFWQNNPCMY